MTISPKYGTAAALFVASSSAVTITIGGLDAPVAAAGGISGMAAGYLQVTVQIPQGVTVGDAVPIVLNIGGIASQPNVTLALQ